MTFLSSRKILTGALIFALALILFFTWVTYRNVRIEEKESRRVAEALEVLHITEKVLDDMQDIESGQRGFIITGDSLFLGPFDTGLVNLAIDTLTVQSLLTRYPNRTEEFAPLLALVKKKLDFSVSSLATVTQRGTDKAAKLIITGKGKILMDSIRLIVADIEEKGRNLLRESNASKEVAARKNAELFIVLTVFFLLAMLILYLRIRQGLSKEIQQAKEILYLGNLVEQTIDAVISTNERGIIKSWNKGAENLFGYTKDEAIGKFVSDITGSGRTPDEMETILKALPESGNLTLQSVVYNKDGKSFFTEGSLTRLNDDNHFFKGIVVVIRDITEKKKSEDLLKNFNNELIKQVEEKTLLLRSMVERIKDGFFSIDSDRCFTYANEFAASIMGTTPEKLLGKNLWAEFSEARQTPAFGFIEEAITLQKTSSIELFYTPFKKWFAAFIYPSSTGASIFFRDITELKEAEKSILHSNERFELISKTTNDAVWEWNLETNEMWGNEVHQRLYGLTMADSIPNENEWQDRLHPDDREVMMLKQAKALASDTNIFITEYRFRTEDRGYRNIYDRCYIVRNNEGKAIRMLGSMMDITERKEAENLLRDSEETRRLIMNSALDAIVCANVNGEITVWNPRAVEIFGWTEQEILGKRISETIIPEHFRDRHERGMKQYLGTGKQNIMNRSIEFTALHKDGREFPVELSIIPVEQGANKFFCSFIRDITKRKEAEEKLFKEKELSDMSVNSLPGIFYMIDEDRKFLRWNKNLETITGYTADEIRQSRPVFFFAPEYRNFALQKAEETFSGEPSAFEAELLTKEGKRIPFYFTGKLVRYEEKNCLIGTGIDITELKKTQDDYRTLVNTIEGIVWEADPSTFRFTFVSRQAERILGYPIQQWLDEPDFWKNHIHPEDINWAVKHCSESTDRMEDHEFEYRMLTKDGRIVWLKDIVTVTEQDGKPGKLRGIMIDITEKKIAEEEILKSNARFQIMSKATSDIIWDLDLGNSRLWWNDNYYFNLGYNKDDKQVTVDDWFTHIHPEDLQRVRTNFIEAINANVSSWRDEYRYCKADGTYLNILDRAYILRDADQKAFRMIGSMVDMTAFYATQKKVIESETRMQTILDTDPECIKLMDAECRVVDINKAGLAMIEAASLQEVYGKSLLMVVSKDYQDAAACLVRNVFEGKEGKLEFEMIGLKGTQRWCEVFVVPFRNAAGEIVNALGVTRDITEKRMAMLELAKNEEKYRTLVEQAVDAIALYDATGNVLDVNTGSVNLLGYSKAELIGMNLKDILTDEEVKTNPVRFDILQQGTSTVKQRKMKRKDGSVVETEVRSQQLPDGRFLSVIRDLTERIEAEQQLEQSYRALRELTDHLHNIREEERSNIAREIHDELGQQLTVLKMDISWLNKKIENPPEKIKERLDELINMVDNTVKSVRRISSELRPSMLDDLGLPAAIEWHTQEFGKRSGIKVETDISTGDVKFPGKVSITVFRVLQECLTNVARHADATKIKVSLAANDGYLNLSIKDNGKGFLTDGIEKKKTLGILGMKERIQIIKGEYLINSAPGKGTVVQVKIPLQDQQ